MRAPISSAWSARISTSRFTPSCLAALSEALLADGFQCMLLNAANAERDMGALIERVLEYRVGAIVVMNGTPPSRIVKECLGNGVPVILVNKPMPGLAVDTVVTDHAAAGARRQSGFSPRMPAARRRVERCADAEPRGTPRSFRARAAEARRPRARLAGRAYRLFVAGATAALAMLAEGAIDGAFCVTDLIALGFLDAARSISVAAFPTTCR